MLQSLMFVIVVAGDVVVDNFDAVSFSVLK